MKVVDLKCQRCGLRFQTETIDRGDPRERHQEGSPVRCPQCRSTYVEVVRVIRQAG